MALTLAKNDARAALVALLRELASYVQFTCNGDRTKLLTSGFPTQKTVLHSGWRATRAIGDGGARRSQR